jgi:sugar phosphate isomerase/epimerase
MHLSVCSYSFHRLLKSEQMDMFQYIAWNDKHGFTQLDPWMAHLEAGYEDDDYIRRVKATADASGLQFGCIAVDGAHVYEADADTRAANRVRAKRWMDISGRLGARQIRIDSGGPEVLTDEILGEIVKGYDDILQHARECGLDVLVENHWGPTIHVDNVVRLLEAVPGLGLLLDTDNWAEGEAEEGVTRCARFVYHTHIKTYPNGPRAEQAEAIALHAMETLWSEGYRGPWGIESIPEDGDEESAVLATQELIERKIEDLMQKSKDSAG